ncbi:ribosome biogenesis protein brix, putative [Eimeria brunetti]|uniref:Ribosome biogenesis protein brix, putative n=1 Tax=Eimeria brunetti TaxID=51314 RepID=U6LPR3_9EIME|nr:ribosome biogenesis protein brix, putative [Eimeria brunetti]
MGRSEAGPAAPTAPAAVNAAAHSGNNSRRIANKRTAAEGTPGHRDAAAQGVPTDQLKQRKKPRLQRQEEQEKLQVTQVQPEKQQEHSERRKKLQQNGRQEQEQQLQKQLSRKQHRQSYHKRQELHMDECGEEHSAADGETPAEETGQAALETTVEMAASATSDSLEAAAAPEGAAEVDTAAAVDAAVAADPYLLEDADYLRRETRWLNRQRVLLLGSRGISARSRHLIEDFKKLLPHHKSEASVDPYTGSNLIPCNIPTKWEKKEKLQSIAELCQLRSCNSVVYLEQRKNDALLHVVKVPLGPTFIARLMNVETLNEVRLTGNCLLYSRPLLIFGAEFDREPHFRVLKELFMQVFGTPRNHPKSKPFFDHAMSFFVNDNRIWFRHYQIAPLVMGEGGDANNPHRQTFIEIGPRFVLDPVKILEGSFCGKTLWRNVEFVRTRDLMRPRRLREALDFARRKGQKEKRRLYLESVLENAPRDKLATEEVFGSDSAVPWVQATRASNRYQDGAKDLREAKKRAPISGIQSRRSLGEPWGSNSNSDRISDICSDIHSRDGGGGSNRSRTISYSSNRSSDNSGITNANWGKSLRMSSSEEESPMITKERGKLQQQKHQLQLLQQQHHALIAVISNSNNKDKPMEPPQRTSLSVSANRWDRETPEAVNTTSAAAYAPDSAVTSAGLPHAAACVGVTRLGKEVAPSKAKELIRHALLLRLPDRAAAASVDGCAAAGRIGMVVAGNCGTRASSAKGCTLQQCGNSHLAGASAAHPPAAAAAATEAAAGTMRHSPRALQPQRISSGTPVVNAAFAAAKQRVLEKQQQLLHYLDCIAAGDLLLRDIQQQQSRPKAPTAFSRLMGALPQQVQHPEELRYHRQRELLQLLQGRSAVQKKQNQQALSRRQQQRQQRLKGTKRQLPTSALQLLYFRLQRKVERIELLQERQLCTQQQHRAATKLNLQRQKYQHEQLNHEHRQQGQQQQQCQQGLQPEQQKDLEQQQSQRQLQQGRTQKPMWGQHQQQIIIPAAQQDQEELPQHRFGGSTFLTACEDTGGPPPLPAGAPPAVFVADRAKEDAVTPISAAKVTAAGIAAASSCAAQTRAGASPLQEVINATNGPAAAAASSPSPAAANHTEFAPDATIPVTASAAMGADTAASAACSDSPIDAAAAHLHRLEAPTPSTLSRCFSSQGSNRQSLMQAAAAPQSLATARSQQLQQLAASRTESLVHFGAVLEAAAKMCDKVMAAREAFKEHVRSNGPRLRRNIINGQASIKSLGVYKHRAHAASRKAEKLQIEEEAAAAAEEQLKREAQALLPYKSVGDLPIRKIEQSRNAFVNFKKRALQEEEAHLATLRNIFQELEATQMMADGLEAAAEEANSRHRDAAGALGLKYAQNPTVFRLYTVGLEKAAEAAAAAAQGAGVRRGASKQQPVQVTEYFIAQQQLLRLRDFIEKLEAVLQDLREETRKQREFAGLGLHAPHENWHQRKAGAPASLQCAEIC